MTESLENEPPEERENLEKNEHPTANFNILRGRFLGNVFSHPKNLLDLKRQIHRSGPLGIF